ncbi:AMP-binding protein [Rhodococcus hoagii]|nr:AMP-binding protein [Prescottella equi]
MPQLLASAVERDPSATALVYQDHSRTYADLDAWSSRLARVLIERGIGPGDAVAVAVPRSIESVSSVWGVAKSGAAYVPIDPNYPADRVAHMVSDSGVVLGLTTTEARDSLPDSVEWLILDDEFDRVLAEHSSEPISFADRTRTLTDADAAYVIYTSGSTGRPKGVVVTQAGLADFCAEQVQRYNLTPQSRTLHFASPSFDASVLELLLAVGSGSTMVIAPPTVYGGEELAALIAAQRVTHGFVTPAALASVDPTGLDTFLDVVVGGEACPPDLVSRWADPRRRFFNGYGPTETTIMTAISDPLVPGRPITIGGPPEACPWRCSTTGCGPPPPVSPASCTCGGPASPAATTTDRHSPPNDSSPARSVSPAPACTGPATWCGGTPLSRSNTSADPTSRSRSADSASNWARSKRSSRRTRTWTSRPSSRTNPVPVARCSSRMSAPSRAYARNVRAPGVRRPIAPSAHGAGHGDAARRDSADSGRQTRPPGAARAGVRGA